MDEVDISGLSKASVLAALYNRAQPQGLGLLHYDPAPMSVEEAEAELVEAEERAPTLDPYFDYLHGRVMKVRLAGDSLDPRLYDRDNGEGAVAEVIKALRMAR